MTPLKPRPHYLNQLLTAPDTAPIKLITGMRRCGKSSLLRLLSEHLKAHGIPAAQIVTLDGERSPLSSTALYHHVKARALPGQRLYLLCDEVQHVPAWAAAVRALQADFDCAIYLTSSQRLSAADTSCLSGRYEEIKVLPLSWREFIAFKDEPGSNPEDLRTLFMHYLRYGGLPSLVAVSAEQALTALDDSYAAVMLHDVLERRGAHPLTDAQLLRTIAQYLAAHLGTPLSVSTLGPKVQAYVRALCDSYCCTAVKRYDLKRHEYLSTLGKFYWAELGRCHYLSGALSSPCGQPELEHVVYWELIGRGYNRD